MPTVACGSGAPSVSQNCWPTRWISLCLHWEHILGETKKIFWCTDPPRGGSSEAPKNCARTPITYRPAQGGGTGLLRLQNKTAPEPLAAPELLVLQNKTAPEPPLPYFGGSTSKKTAPEPPLPILLPFLVNDLFYTSIKRTITMVSANGIR